MKTFLTKRYCKTEEQFPLQICGERAARHVHYGATTCFSCRAFFRSPIFPVQFYLIWIILCAFIFLHFSSGGVCRTTLQQSTSAGAGASVTSTARPEGTVSTAGQQSWNPMWAYFNVFGRYMKCLSVGMNPNYVLTEEEKHKRFHKKKGKRGSESGDDVMEISSQTGLRSGKMFKLWDIVR